MKKTIFTGLLLLIILSGCASLTKINNLTLFEQVHRAYRLALWDSDFQAAKLALGPDEKARTQVDDHQYSDIKVARYKVLKTSSNGNGSEVRQEVEIQYYRQNRPLLKYMYDNQVWRYHSDKKNWYLESGLPAFK